MILYYQLWDDIHFHRDLLCNMSLYLNYHQDITEIPTIGRTTTCHVLTMDRCVFLGRGGEQP